MEEKIIRVKAKKKEIHRRVKAKEKRIHPTDAQQKPLQKTQYTYADVFRFLGVKRVALQEWMALGYITPHFKAQGQGTKHLYNKENLVEIKLFRHLVDTGHLRAQAARRVKGFNNAMSLYGSSRFTRPLVLRFIVKEENIKAELFSTGDMESSRKLIEGDPEIYRVENINIGRIIDEVDTIINE